MKYAVFYKKFDELDGDDFDKEVLNQYENLTLKKEGLSCTVNGQEVITTIDNLMQDMCEKQVELIFDSLIERIEALEQTPKRGKWVHGKEVSRDYIGDTCVRILYEDWHCSSCKIKVEKPYKPNWDYCPHCGARMESDIE